MTLEEYEAIRSQMSDDGEAGCAELAEEEEEEEPARAYASEGQQGYISSTADVG